MMKKGIRCDNVKVKDCGFLLFILMVCLDRGILFENLDLWLN